jgi:hypothetical protein
MLNLLVIVLDALREDVASSLFDETGRSLKARCCVAAAPWTLPSCTSLITGLSATRHHHYWNSGQLRPSHLVDALPAVYRKVGLINNTVLDPTSQLHLGFDKWTYFEDHVRPFSRAMRYVRRARGGRPLFLFVHSNIPHDYYLEGAGRYFDEAYPESAGGAYTLEERVISWRDTTPTERAAVAPTYRASAIKAVARTRELLALARARDDFVAVVVSDHGEGLDYEAARLHHGGRVHDDLLRVPLYIDVPSSLPRHRCEELAASLESSVVATTDVLPTLFALAGVKDLPDIDGRPALAPAPERVVVSEDRRYLYFKDRFRLNVLGRGKNMSAEEGERNARLRAVLAGPPVVRSYRSESAKLILTCLQLKRNAEPSAARQRLLELGGDLMGSPALALQEERLYAFESYDLRDDPGETRNRLSGDRGWAQELASHPCARAMTVPAGLAGDDGEVELRSLLEASELIAGA